MLFDNSLDLVASFFDMPEIVVNLVHLYSNTPNGILSINEFNLSRSTKNDCLTVPKRK